MRQSRRRSKHISAHFTAGTFHDAVPAAARLCEEFDIRIGIHCHGGYMFGGSPDVLDVLFKLGGPKIGINLDTAWCMQIGPNGNPIQWVRERFKGKIFGVHYKDFIFDRRGQWTDVVVGTGNLDLPGFVRALEETGFDGMAVIEYEADPENPVPALTDCVKKMPRPCPIKAAGWPSRGPAFQLTFAPADAGSDGVIKITFPDAGSVAASNIPWLNLPAQLPRRQIRHNN